MSLTQINVSKRRRIPFVVKNNLGIVDVTTDVTAGSNNQANVTAVIDPTNKRKLIVSVIGYPGQGNVTVSVTSPFGDTVTLDVFVPAPADQSSVVFGEPEAEEDIQ